MLSRAPLPRTENTAPKAGCTLFKGLVRLLCELERFLSGLRTRAMDHDLSLVMPIFIPHVEKLL